jgi:hypothetical protein
MLNDNRIIRNLVGGSARLLKSADNQLTDNGQRSTAHLIKPQTFFSLVSGEKADNRKIYFLITDKVTHLSAKETPSSFLPLIRFCYLHFSKIM